MNGIMAAWGVVMLIIFAAAHYAVPSYLAANYMWVVLAIIIIVMNMIVGRTMKNASASSKGVWMSLSAFGFITTLIVAFGVLPLPLWWLMSLWLLLMGAAKFSEGHANGMQMMTYSGVILVFASLFVSSFGESWYFMAGALFFGLLGLINGLLFKAESGKK